MQSTILTIYPLPLREGWGGSAIMFTITTFGLTKLNNAEITGFFLNFQKAVNEEYRFFERGSCIYVSG